MGERLLCKQDVASSILVTSTIVSNAGLAHLVERRSCKADVVSSNPTTGTSSFRSVAQSGSAPGLGPGGPRFESLYSDQVNVGV